MPHRRQTSGNRRTRLVAGLVTLFFVAIASMIAGLLTVGILSITASTNAIDNDRAVRAASSAFESMRDKLNGVLRDNAYWDDAYNALNGDQARDWATENWGVTTADYPLYDTAVVIDPRNDELVAYRSGVEFYAGWMFDPSFKVLIERVRTSNDGIGSEFIRTTNGYAVIGAARVRPTTIEVPKNTGAHVLVFAKDITDEVLKETADNFDIPGLVLSEQADAHKLSYPLRDGDGHVVAFVNWPGKEPGTLSFKRVQRLLFSAIAILFVFLTLILVVGYTVIRDLKRSGARAQYKAAHDSLSGLLNRAGFLDEIATELTADKSASGSVWLYLLDLDGFKMVNDTWGHSTGDELICIVSSRLKSIASRDALVARLGGDEFAIAVRQTSETDNLSDLILSIFENTFRINNLFVEVGVSIGVSQTGPSEIDYMELMRRADVALYRAKESGRGRKVQYSPEFDNERVAQIQFEDKLRNAIAMHDIDVHFQPLFRAHDRIVTGVEALARWTTAAGRIAPDVFIPLAERAGLIDALGTLVLGRAIDEARQWPGIEVSVNVSPLQLRNPNYAAGVIDMLQAKEFDATRLTLEITESVLISFPEQAKRAINALRAAGVKFALDDFGSGYASLGALQEFQFDRMKIDRSLINGLDGSEQKTNVLVATVALATALNVQVTAEGIETEEQAEVVTRSGCQILQGYLLGRPMSAVDVTAIINGRRDRTAA